MKMQDVVVGKVYRRVESGRNGVRISSQHVMVDETYVAKQYSDRKDRVRGHLVNPVRDDDGNPTGEFQYTGSYGEDGKPWPILLMARELMTLEGVEKHEAAQRAEEEKRERRRAAQREFQDSVAIEIAKRLGAAKEHVHVNSTIESEPDEEGNYECHPYRATVDQEALEAMLESDPDPEIICAAIQQHFKVPMNQQITATPAELTEIIVDALRPEPEEDEGEEE
jgi:hypothetical protein